jgi:hypothetical protein
LTADDLRDMVVANPAQQREETRHWHPDSPTGLNGLHHDGPDGVLEKRGAELSLQLRERVGRGVGGERQEPAELRELVAERFTEMIPCGGVQ